MLGDVLSLEHAHGNQPPDQEPDNSPHPRAPWHPLPGSSPAAALVLTPDSKEK